MHTLKYDFVTHRSGSARNILFGLQRSLSLRNGGFKIYFQHFIQHNSWIPLFTVSSNENIEAGSFDVGEQTFN
jgi:hypothetical protein